MKKWQILHIFHFFHNEITNVPWNIDIIRKVRSRYIFVESFKGISAKLTKLDEVQGTRYDFIGLNPIVSWGCGQFEPQALDRLGFNPNNFHFSTRMISNDILFKRKGITNLSYRFYCISSLNYYQIFLIGIWKIPRVEPDHVLRLWQV